MARLGKENREDGTSFDVTVLVLTYHPVWEALALTLRSVLMQRDVSLEIIVADDGSEVNFARETERLFQAYGFSDYQLLEHTENRGTISNYISGLEAARGRYTKSISPGDFLTGPEVLRKWLSSTVQEGWDWSFSDAVYYRMQGENPQFLPTPPFPVYLKPYEKRDAERERWNYTVLDDAALGATMLGRTSLKLSYARELQAIGNKYAEDYLFRLMMFDGVPCGYFPETTVFYEHGTGISSGGDPVWQKRIQEEFFRMNTLLLARPAPDAFRKRMQRALRRKTSFVGMLLVPGKLRRYLLFQVIRRKPRMDTSGAAAWIRACRGQG